MVGPLIGPVRNGASNSTQQGSKTQDQKGLGGGKGGKKEQNRREGGKKKGRKKKIREVGVPG